MIRCFAILMCFSALLARADDAATKLTTAGIAEFTAAYQAWEAARFGQAAELFRQASTNTSATATNFYWLGAAQFHRMLQLQNSAGSSTNKNIAAAALDAAVESLSTAVNLDEKHAESHALLATLYGIKIRGSFLRAAWLGARIGKHHDAAVHFGKDNPRIAYLTGMCRFHTADKPAEWREALTNLLRAEKLFDVEAKSPVVGTEPRWGRSSCLTFIGKTYEKLSDSTNALNYFQRALEAHPEDHLAKEGFERLKKQENK